MIGLNHLVSTYCNKLPERGPAEWFNGSVRIDPIFQAPDPAFVQDASVSFEPGARTAWRTHPQGQTLIVAAGCGWVQSETLGEEFMDALAATT